MRANELSVWTALAIVSTKAVLCFVPSGAATTSSIDCGDSIILGNALKTVGDQDWARLSEADLHSIWPTEVGSLDCKDAACQTRSQKDKVLSDESECCELFNFEMGRDDNGGRSKNACIAS
jgi:hypothetical protein